MGTTKKVLKEKTYALINMSPLSLILKVGMKNELIVLDKDKKENRAIRHCPNEKSIFTDEQSKFAVIKPLIFFNGVINTSPEEYYTQMFLEAHPDKGRIFNLVNLAESAKEENELMDIILDIKMAIRSKAEEKDGIEILRGVVGALQGIGTAAGMSSHEVIKAAYEEVDLNYKRFVNEKTDEVTIFDDPSIIQDVVAQGAFKAGLVTLSSDASKVIWADNKSTICHVPMGTNHVEFFANFLGTEEGVLVSRELAKRS